MDYDKIVKSLSKTQKANLLAVYEFYQKSGIKHEDKQRQLGRGLKTGSALYRKGLVGLSAFQLTNWTMWEITELGIRIAELLKEVS